MDRPRMEIIGKDACEECLELMEIAVLDGDGILDDAPASARAHIDECPDCSALENAIALLREVPLASSELGSRAARDYFARKRRNRIRLAVGLPFAASLAAAAAALLMLGTPSIEENKPMGDELGLQVVLGKPIVAGSEAPVGADLVEGQEISTGAESALAEASSKLSIAMDGHTKLALKSLRRNRVRINLESGHLAVHLAKRSGVDLVVDAQSARIIVTGTVFSVERMGNDVNVAVVQGAVRVESDEWQGESVEVTQGNSFSVRTRKSNPVATESERSIFSLLRMRAREDRASVEESPRGGVETPSSESDDVVQAVPPEEEREAKEARPEESARSSSRNGAEDRREDRETQGRGPAESALTSGDLIRAARECRNSRDWRCAAAAYEQVIAMYPNSAESVTVLVPLAQIELEYLKRPGSALEHYDHYLRLLPRGPLAQEALYGKCRAFSSVGKIDEEEDTLEEFLDKYPKSVYAPNARSRLLKLKAL